jgi:hypothetical protein
MDGSSGDVLLGIWCEDLRGADEGGALVTIERLMLTDALGPLEAVECGGRWAICRPSCPTAPAADDIVSALHSSLWASPATRSGAAWFQTAPVPSAPEVAAGPLQVAPQPQTFRMHGAARESGATLFPGLSSREAAGTVTAVEMEASG